MIGTHQLSCKQSADAWKPKIKRLKELLDKHHIAFEIAQPASVLS
jgi:hypothetical protein